MGPHLPLGVPQPSSLLHVFETVTSQLQINWGFEVQNSLHKLVLGLKIEQLGLVHFLCLLGD
uniref:Uncharacterized protein n=1 Tax=Rhizophora mucronata TaxID=61149 RepID=A0A2P2PIU6_RHIMU